MSKALEIRLLERLVRAQDAGRPITHGQLGVETRGSTFDDLWQSGHIMIEGQDNLFACHVTKDSAYIVPPSGRAYLARLAASS